MVTTNDERLWRRMWEYKDHGKSWEAVYEREHAPGFRWLHDSFGTNWRMNEMQGVIGRIQTARLPAWRASRIANAEAIWKTCRGIDWLRVPPIPAEIEHAAYKAYVFVDPERLPDGWSRDAVVEALVAEGVPAYQGSCSEVYLEKAFDGTGYRPKRRLPVARELGETSMMFLVHPTLCDSHVEATCSALTTVAERVAAGSVGSGGAAA